MKRFIIAVVVTFISLHSFGQGEADVWYIGSNIKFDFSGGGNPVVSDGITVGPLGSLYESSSSISDQNGGFLFGVVGTKLYDGGQNSILNLPSNTWDVAQGSLIFPKPGTVNGYYLSVLTHGSSGTAGMSKYYEVTVNGTGSGNAIVSSAMNLVSNLTQAQAGVPKINAAGDVLDEYWMLTHETCNDAFKLFSVTNSGIALSRTINSGTSLTCKSSPSPAVYDEIGVLKFNSCYTRFAYAIGGKVMLFDFDAENGDITFVNQVTSINQPYGLEFSSNSNYLYVLKGQDNTVPGQVYRIPVNPGGLGAPTSIGSTGGQRGGHLQLAPDKNIYYAASRNYDVGLGGIGRIVNVDAGGTLQNDFYVARGNPQFPATALPQAVMMDLPNFLRSFV